MNDLFYVVSVLILLAACAVLALLLGVCRTKNRRITDSAYTDPDSGALNTAGFFRQADGDAHGKMTLFAVVVMQIPSLSYLSLHRGADGRAAFLAHIRAAFRSQLGEEESLARSGEDTFYFLLRNRRPDEIRAKLSNITAEINAFRSADGGDSIYVKPLFGVYLPEDAGEDPRDCVRRACDALAAIPRGRRFGFYDEDLRRTAEHNRDTAQRIPAALRSGEFLVYLQPQVRISDQKIVGAEALARWRHPRKGIISPEMFLPAADNFGMTGQIDRFILKEVCRLLSQWQEAGLELCPISLNLSADSVGKAELAEECAAICREAGIPTSVIEFEMKEDMLLADPEEARTLIEHLHAAGFRVAVDNFGASQCSLQLLGSFSLDTLKLDESFFSGDNNNRSGRYLIESLLRLAAQMHIRTVAEGVDSDGQVQYLRQAACDGIQGFYYFQPMSADRFRTDAYEDGKLRYITETRKSTQRRESTADVSANNRNITLFTYNTTEDLLIFSDPFSPVLGGQRTFENGLALFRTTDLIHENDRRDFLRLIERCHHEEGWPENTLRFHMAQGRYEWLEVRVHRDGPMISGMLADMSGWKSEVNRWKEKATRDALTGLYNREHFEQNTASILSHNKYPSGALIFIDVDDFKQVNDTLGHMVGDDVLCHVAKQILGVFRHTDIIARYGGDEFVVFAPSIEADILKKRLEKLLSNFSHPYRSGNVQHKVSITVGAALYPADGADYDTLLHHADCALYEAKENGKNRFVLYEPYMLGEASDAPAASAAQNG